MSKLPMERKMLNISLIISTIGIIIFSFMGFINWSFLSGWTVGIIFVFIMLFTNSIFFKKIFNKKRTKLFAFLSSFVRSLTVALIFVGIIFAIIYIDGYTKNHVLFKTTTTSDLYGPINVFTFLGGIGVYGLSTFLAHISKFNKNNNEEMKRYEWICR
ncbi:MAG: hypothetical protein NC236_02535 [Mycoplasma sp.]|nr:hypothetical protein [Mycoplasma sp.]